MDNQNETLTTNSNPTHPLKSITPLSRYLALGLFIALPFLGGFIGYSYGLKQAVMEPMVLTVPTVGDEVVEPVTSERGDSRSLEEIFDLANKQPGTELFFSSEWGVGFTYPSIGYNQSPITVKTEGSVITLLLGDDTSGPSLEVFAKDPQMTIEDEIANRFLAGYDREKCYLVKLDKIAWLEGSEIYGYEKYSIRYDMIQNPQFGQTPWDNAKNCPEHYSQTNAAQFFIYNPQVPDRYLFGVFGQDSVTNDGRPNKDWSGSIKILPRG